MSSQGKPFRHSSLQDADSIADILTALRDGMQKGKLQLTDEDADILLRPKGLVEVSIDAEENNGINTLSLKLRWNESGKKVDRKSLKIR